MGLPKGVHHLVIATRDIKAPIEFFTQVVGMEFSTPPVPKRRKAASA